VVVDAPRATPDVAAALVKASTQTYLLFEMNVEDIRIVKMMLAALEHRGIERDAVTPLAMRHRPRRDPITIEEACRAIGASRIETIANDYSNAVTSVNYGKTLAETAPRSDIRRDIQKLATSVYEQAPCAKA
jgi:pilus assembly protein CpaE